MQYATTVMNFVNSPFKFETMEEVDHFRRNHEIRVTEETVEIKIPMFFKFETIKTPIVIVRYNGMETKVNEYEYEDGQAAWWATRGAWQVRKELGLGFWDYAPIPVIKHF